MKFLGVVFNNAKSTLEVMVSDITLLPHLYRVTQERVSGTMRRLFGNSYNY